MFGFEELNRSLLGLPDVFAKDREFAEKVSYYLAVLIKNHIDRMGQRKWMDRLGVWIDPVRVIARVNIPTLIIETSHDTLVPPTQQAALKEAASRNPLLIMEDHFKGGHLKAWHHSRKEYAALVQQWFLP